MNTQHGDMAPTMVLSHIKESASDIVNELGANRARDEKMIKDFKSAIDQQVEKTFEVIKHSMQVMYMDSGQKIDSKIKQFNDTIQRIDRLEEDIRASENADKSGEFPRWDDKKVSIVKERLLGEIQQMGEMIQKKREEDEIILYDFKNEIVQKVKDSIIAIQHSMQNEYVKNTEQMDKKLIELGRTLERCEQLERDVRHF